MRDVVPGHGQSVVTSNWIIVRNNLIKAAIMLRCVLHCNAIAALWFTPYCCSI